MSQQRDQSRVTETLRQASAAYDDLPEDVEGRLDRVLDQLPAADTLHRSDSAKRLAVWAERLRPKRVRYAIVSTAAAVLMTVGAVAVALQIVADPAPEEDASVLDAGAGSLSEESERSEGTDDAGADSGAQGETDSGESAPEGAEETTEVETFSTGSDYPADADLLTALRDLDDESADGDVPAELRDLAEGGEYWQRCQEAIIERYSGLLVAVDFARYDAEPAVVALLVADSGEVAVAVGPDCADGVIDELEHQE